MQYFLIKQFLYVVLLHVFFFLSLLLHFHHILAASLLPNVVIKLLLHYQFYISPTSDYEKII